MPVPLPLLERAEEADKLATYNLGYALYMLCEQEIMSQWSTRRVVTHTGSKYKVAHTQTDFRN